MNTIGLKLGSRNFTLTLSGEEDIGQFTAQFMKTVINLLSVLATDGYTASRVVLDGTSIHSVRALSTTKSQALGTMDYARLAMPTLLTYGLSLVLSQDQLKEYHLKCSMLLGGDYGLITILDCKEVPSSRISIRVKPKYAFTKLDTWREIEDLPLQEIASRFVTDLSVLRIVESFLSSLKVAETQSSSGWQEYRQSHSHQQAQEQSSGEWSTIAVNTDSYLSQYQTATWQETSSCPTFTGHTLTSEPQSGRTSEICMNDTGSITSNNITQC